MSKSHKFWFHLGVLIGYIISGVACWLGMQIGVHLGKAIWFCLTFKHLIFWR